MIQVVKLNKAYSSQVLLRDVSFNINAGEKIGLVGRNGHGKTTLLRIVACQEEIDSGQVVFPDHYKVGYLSQHLKFTQKTVLEEGAQGLVDSEDGWERTYRVEAVLQGLGFIKSDFEKSPSELSGGYQLRLNLAKLLVSEPDLLLLDEPTNYLDILSLRWLIRCLQEWKGEMLLITHDRDFMNKVITHTLGIHRARVRKIKGTTDRYYQKIAQDEEIYEQTRLNQEQKREEAEAFIRRFRAKATKARQVQSRIKALEKSDSVEKLSEIKSLSFSFPKASFSGKWFIQAENMSFGYDSDRTPLFSDLSFSVGAKDRIAVIGRNGKGKTTLLKLLTEEIQLWTGSIVPSANIKLGYFGQTNIDRLDSELTVEQEILNVQPDHSRGIARTICGAMMFEGDLALKKVKVLSGGEKSRVLLGKLLAVPSNCLVLDEPTNHLDMESTDAFCSALERFEGSVIMVTHSEMLLRKLATRLIVFDGDDAFLYEGGYEDFLTRIGWKEEVREQQKKAAESTTQPSRNKKQLRQARGQIIARRSKALSPLKSNISKIESKIMDLEAQIKEHNEVLISASAGESEAISRLLRSLHTDQTEVDKLYDELDKLTQELENLSEEFEVELRALDE